MFMTGVLCTIRGAVVHFFLKFKGADGQRKEKYHLINFLLILYTIIFAYVSIFLYKRTSFELVQSNFV